METLSSAEHSKLLSLLNLHRDEMAVAILEMLNNYAFTVDGEWGLHESLYDFCVRELGNVGIE